MQIDRAIFAERLRSLMSETHTTNYALANAMNLSQSTVANWLNQKSTPSNRSLLSLADFFGVLPAWLSGQTDVKRSKAEEYLREAARVRPALDDDITELLEELRGRDDMRMLFKVAKGATREDVLQAVKIIEALRK